MLEVYGGMSLDTKSKVWVDSLDQGRCRTSTSGPSKSDRLWDIAKCMYKVSVDALDQGRDSTSTSGLSQSERLWDIAKCIYKVSVDALDQGRDGISTSSAREVRTLQTFQMLSGRRPFLYETLLPGSRNALGT